MVDTLDALTQPLPPDDLPPLELTLFVCDHVNDDGTICGADFDSNAKLNGHRQGKHRDRSGDARKGEGGKPKADKAPSRPSAQADKARAMATAHTDRAAAYKQSIAMGALGLYVVVPVFDDYDLETINRGAANLASALEEVGQQNKTVQRTCDLILGGGSSGAYVKLVLAALMIGAPIAAHHGLIPTTLGEQFGGAPVPASGSPPPQATTPDAGTPATNGDGAGVQILDPHTMTDDDWLNLLMGIPPNVMANLAGRMMQGEGPTVVSVPSPGHDAYDIPDGTAQPVPGEEERTPGREG